jgi:hypothetical protein
MIMILHISFVRALEVVASGINETIVQTDTNHDLKSEPRIVVKLGGTADLSMYIWEERFFI